MKNINRRSFLKTSLLTTAALSLPARSWAQVNGANDDIRVAVVGFHGRGKSHIDGFSKNSGSRVVALCDVDQHVLEGGAKKFKDRNEPIETYTDVRKLLENKDIDAISIATPNHWHSLLAIWAIQAGKDVYVEKPVSHNIWEGRQLVKAAHQHKKIVQTGTQCRSNPGLQEAIAWVQEGNLGAIKLARGLCYKPRNSIGNVTSPTPIPDYIDYDLWCGPSPKVPLMRERLHYDWHWVWRTGNGDLGNQGIHQMDIARWVLQENALSPRVLGVGGRLGYVDDANTPNTLFVFHDYDKAPLIFEVRGLKTDDYRGAKIGVIVQCEGGHLVIPSYSTAVAYDKDGKEIKQFKGGADHFANFLKAVRSRHPKDLNAEITEGHLSSALCHMGNDSYRVGEEHSPEEVREDIKGNKEATETFNRMAEHLAANNVDLEKTGITLGQHLKMDPKKERYLNSEKANELARGTYRAPFVVPERV